MTDPNDVNGNLARDYLIGAENFLSAADKICAHTDENTEEWLFKLESPVIFLLGHSAELILKSALTKLNLLTKDIKYSHDLILLMECLQRAQRPIDPDFARDAATINDNFKSHDQRYQRAFSGFPEEQHERLMQLTSKNTQEAKQELRNYGLIVRRGVNAKGFLLACHKQLSLTSNWVYSPLDRPN